MNRLALRHRLFLKSAVTRLDLHHVPPDRRRRLCEIVRLIFYAFIVGTALVTSWLCEIVKKLRAATNCKSFKKSVWCPIAG